MPYNENKESEHGELATEPQPGQTVEPTDPAATGSTLSEANATGKTGTPGAGREPGNAPLERVRVDSSGRVLTTNQGVPVADNQNSLKAGLRGPTLMEDFILREKITHFDHERIPERIVHARGSGAHGFFECYKSLTKYTRASLFAEAGKRTPVFVRFSTVAGERGSTDTARDVRGFAVKFYTDEGNWDLVGNNIPVFFIQDAMKFPDLVHAVKPEPHHGMPQAASAHDTFWDFVSLMPESTHMLMWVMSDRAIPRSYRMMQGFGVHTFRLVNAQGESSFVKFHWNPVLGTHSLDWDEAVKISGADPDFHRRDLWEAIESGNYPEWELGMQIFTEEQADKFSFDVLDPTKIVPEELVPVMPVGRMVLNRNPDNFFAETEQVAFCAAHIVPGIDFTNDPLLAGPHPFLRRHADLAPRRAELPRDPDQRAGRAGAQQPARRHAPAGDQPRPRRLRAELARRRLPVPGRHAAASPPSRDPRREDKVRGKPEKFADHYTQATLFWNSQTPVEKAHIIRALPLRADQGAGRRRSASAWCRLLANVADELAQGVADGLGIEVPEPMPRALERPTQARGRAVAGAVAVRAARRRRHPHAAHRDPGRRRRRRRGGPGACTRGCSKAGAVPRFVGARLGAGRDRAGRSARRRGHAGDRALGALRRARRARRRRGGRARSATSATRSSSSRTSTATASRSSPSAPAARCSRTPAPRSTSSPASRIPACCCSRKATAREALREFIEAIAKHRHFERETDPPLV